MCGHNTQPARHFRILPTWDHAKATVVYAGQRCALDLHHGTYLFNKTRPLRTIWANITVAVQDLFRKRLYHYLEYIKGFGRWVC